MYRSTPLGETTKPPTTGKINAGALNAGIVPIRGEKQYTPKRESIERARERDKAWKRFKRETSQEYKIAHTLGTKRYRESVGLYGHWNKWTIDELVFLAIHMGHYPARVIALAMGKSIQAIQGRIQKFPKGILRNETPEGRIRHAKRKVALLSAILERIHTSLPSGERDQALNNLKSRGLYPYPGLHEDVQGGKQAQTGQSNRRGKLPSLLG